MTDLPDTDVQPRLAETFAEAEDALLSRWPETKLDPTLDRITAFLDVLGNPQAGYPVIHLTGTNGKTSTSRMIDTPAARRWTCAPAGSPARTSSG